MAKMTRERMVKARAEAGEERGEEAGGGGQQAENAPDSTLPEES